MALIQLPLLEMYSPQVSRAMTKNFVKVSPTLILTEAIKYVHGSKQNFVVIVEGEDFLEGILTNGDIRRYLSKQPSSGSKDDSVSPNVCSANYFTL